MNGLSDPASARRFRWCLVLSVVLTTVGFSWLGRLWAPRALHVAAPERRRYLRFAVLSPPPPRPIIVRRVTPRPLPKLPKRKVVVRKTLRPKPRPTPRVKIRERRATLSAASQHRNHNPMPAPSRAPRGGGSSHAPALAAANVPPTVPTLLPPAQQPVLLSKRSTLRITLPPIATYDIPAAPALPARDTSGGVGSSNGSGSGQGQSPGNGQGSGLGPGSGAGGSPFGVGSGGEGGGLRHIVYVLDISGSMTSRIDRARQELRASIAGLGPGESFDIITFSDVVHEFSDSMNPATPQMEQRADYFLSTLEVRGGTNLEGALAYALGLPGVNVVFVLTDGVPTQAPGVDFIDHVQRYMDELPRRVRELNIHHARIYTVGLVGKDPDGRDESFEAAGMLRQIAHDSGGVSKIVPLGVAVPE